jgi:uncharacterized membrane protein YsdA (DUF1294 family)
LTHTKLRVAIDLIRSGSPIGKRQASAQAAMIEPRVYILCVLTGATGAWLLLSSYRRHRQRLLLWNAICFSLLALTSLLVLVAIILLPDVDLLPLRLATNLLAIGMLLHGFVWESASTERSWKRSLQAW